MADCTEEKEGQYCVNPGQQLNPLARIGLPTLRSVMYVHVSEILYCKGESSQTSVHLVGNKKIIITRTLKQCESLLEGYGFCRIHKSNLINLSHVRRYFRGESKGLELSDGSHLEVSPNFKAIFLSRLPQP